MEWRWNREELEGEENINNTNKALIHEILINEQVDRCIRENTRDKNIFKGFCSDLCSVQN